MADYNIIEEFEKLRKKHYYCEDCWYSCPKAEDGCCNEDFSDNKCNCGADEHNAILDEIIRRAGRERDPYLYKCRKCKKYIDDTLLIQSENPSGHTLYMCPCGGIVDHNYR